MRSELERELTQIRSGLSQLSKQAIAATQRAVKTLVTGDAEGAKQIRVDDKAIDALRYQVELDSLTAMARQQPVAHDARELLAATLVAVELERCGDYAKGIARAASRIASCIQNLDTFNIAEIDALVRSMLERSVHALLTNDAAEAEHVLRDDAIVDALYGDLLRHIMAMMSRDPRNIEAGLWLLHAAHCLERIGDRATNIAERAIFVATGEQLIRED
ncbi:MAG: phosphate signaling complex protein PhoU [Anaerolineae bacterium]|nr:phosphate signaling complex protein PhoU [Thermoflexales bacterium]MDW8394942.1 phosphate signaling complex protein PhoU [Anaerolineae bacterium]